MPSYLIHNLKFGYIKLLLFIFAFFIYEFAFSLSSSITGLSNFGSLTIGQTSTSTLTLKNTSRSQIRLNSSTLNSSVDYKLLSSGTCNFNGSTLRSGRSCTVVVQITATTIGATSSQLALNYYLGSSTTKEENVMQFSSINIEPIATAPVLNNWLNVSGNKILNSAGQPVQLKGVSIADPEVLDLKTWERPNVSARGIASLATDTFNAKVVRLPILPGNSAYPNEGFFSATNGWDKYFNNHILPVVTDLTNKGVYVIIDLHYVSDYSALYPQVESFWKYMAPKFANNPYVFYEIFNEPILPDNWATWKSTIAQPIVNLIRTYAPNNLILVGGPYWSSHISGAATDAVVGTNLVYIAHVYSNQTSVTLWESRYGAVADKFPLFITEWGFESGGTEGGDLTWGQSFHSWMLGRGLSWTAWCFDTLWGPRMFNPDWTLKTSPTGMGEFVRDSLAAPPAITTTP